MDGVRVTAYYGFSYCWIGGKDKLNSPRKSVPLLVSEAAGQVEPLNDARTYS